MRSFLNLDDDDERFMTLKPKDFGKQNSLIFSNSYNKLIVPPFVIPSSTIPPGGEQSDVVPKFQKRLGIFKWQVFGIPNKDGMLIVTNKPVTVTNVALVVAIIISSCVVRIESTDNPLDDSDDRDPTHFVESNVTLYEQIRDDDFSSSLVLRLVLLVLNGEFDADESPEANSQANALAVAGNRSWDSNEAACMLVRFAEILFDPDNMETLRLVTDDFTERTSISERAGQGTFHDEFERNMEMIVNGNNYEVNLLPCHPPNRWESLLGAKNPPQGAFRIGHNGRSNDAHGIIRKIKAALSQFERQFNASGDNGPQCDPSAETDPDNPNSAEGRAHAPRSLEEFATEQPRTIPPIALVYFHEFMRQDTEPAAYMRDLFATGHSEESIRNSTAKPRNNKKKDAANAFSVLSDLTKSMFASFEDHERQERSMMDLKRKDQEMKQKDQEIKLAKLALAEKKQETKLVLAKAVQEAKADLDLKELQFRKDAEQKSHERFQMQLDATAKQHEATAKQYADMMKLLLQGDMHHSVPR